MDRRRKERKRICSNKGKGKSVVNLITAVFLVLFVGAWVFRGLGYEPYRILTGSMEPTLKEGEIVFINTNDTDVDEGDIIAFYVGENVVIHRIKEKMADGMYITKGDANPTVDFNPVEQAEIIGTLAAKLGVMTWIWRLWESEWRYLLVLGLILLNVFMEVSGNLKGGEELEYI